MNTKKDFHPGSEDKVVDLAHPSLFPVIYGRSRIFTDRLISLDDCLNHVGDGILLPTPTDDRIHSITISIILILSAQSFSGCLATFTLQATVAAVLCRISTIFIRRRIAHYTECSRNLSHSHSFVEHHPVKSGQQ
jgi:hypothetical protein